MLPGPAPGGVQAHRTPGGSSDRPRRARTSGVEGIVLVPLLEPLDQLLDPDVVGQQLGGGAELTAKEAVEGRVEEEHRVAAERPVGAAGIQEVDRRRRQAAQVNLPGDAVDQLVALLFSSLRREHHRTASAAWRAASKAA